MSSSDRLTQARYRNDWIIGPTRSTPLSARARRGTADRSTSCRPPLQPCHPRGDGSWSSSSAADRDFALIRGRQAAPLCELVCASVHVCDVQDADIYWRSDGEEETLFTWRVRIESSSPGGAPPRQ